MFTDIKVGFTCNNQCTHCVIAPSKAKLVDDGLCVDDDTATIMACIDVAASTGSEGIVLTGGEVTIRPDFAALVEYGLKKGMAVTVQTNGRALSDKATVSFLRGSRPVQFVVAVHGPDACVHDDITRRRGSYSETMQAIANLLEFDHVRVVGKVVISRRNISCLAETFEALVNSGVTNAVLAFPHAEEFPGEVFAAVVPKYSDLEPELYRVLEVAREKTMNVMLETVPYCTFPQAPSHWLCSQDIRYSIQRQASRASIHTPGSPDLKSWDVLRPLGKHKSASCVRCLMDKVCEGPWLEYVDQFGDAEFVPLQDPDVVKLFCGI